MRIQKIIIKNLATLQDAEIDFSVEPLNNSPLFLICGDTGAGKSTITDAVCLSLYGKTPRFESVEKEDINNEKSEINSTKDSRHIMRHGATEALAATIFSTEDGKVYKAEWSVQRARKKADGTLHSAKNTLYIKNSVDFEPVTEKQKEFESEITRLTGLNFERYIRCVMLAQNQFSKFLYADRDTKSSILQMLTNTDIYEKISTRIFDKYKEAKTNLEFAKQRKTEIKLLSPDQILALNNQKAELENTIRHGDEENQKNLSRINWKKTSIEYGKTFSAKSSELNAALEQQKTSEPQRLVLKQLDAVNSTFRNIYQNLDNIKSDLEKNERSFKAQQISYCQYVNEYESLKQKHLAVTQKISELEKKYGEMSVDSDIYENIQTVDSLLDNYKTQNQELKSEEAKINSAKNKISELTSKLENISKDFNELENRRTELKAKSDKKDSEQKSIDISKVNADDKVLDNKVKTVLGAMTILTNYNNAQNNIAKLERQAAEYSKTLLEADTLIKKLTTDEVSAQAAYDMADKMYKNQMLIASKNIEDLRKTLKLNEPCPVCGSTDHPFAQHTEQMLKSQLESLKHDLSTSEAKLREIQTTLRAKKSEVSNIAALKKQCENDIAPEKKNLDDNGARLLKAIEFFNNSENIAIKTIEELGFQLPILQKKYDDCKAVLNSKKTEYSRLDSEAKSARKEYELANEKFEKAKTDKVNCENDILILKNSIVQFQNNLDNIKSKKLSALTSLKNYFQDSQTISTIDNNTITFKTYIDNKAKVFNQLKQDITDTKTINDNYLRIEANSKRIEELRQYFPDVTVTQNNNIDESSFEKLPQNISSLETNVLNILGQTDDNRNRLKVENEKIDSEIVRISSENPELLLSKEKVENLLNYSSDDAVRIKEKLAEIDERVLRLKQSVADAQRNVDDHNKKPESTEEDLQALEDSYNSLKKQIEDNTKLVSEISFSLKTDENNQKNYLQIESEIENLTDTFNSWSNLNDALGSKDGKKLRVYAQNYTLQILLKNANYNLQKLMNKYQLTCQGESLAIFVNDLEMGTERPTSTLSGGESFMVSLCLALGLSDMMQNGIQSQTLFIDEGFGTLDEDSLNHVITMLEKLKSQGRQVGIISHVKELQERISAKIFVQKTSGDNTRSTVRVVNN